MKKYIAALVLGLCFMCIGGGSHVLRIKPYDPNEDWLAFETIDLKGVLRLSDGQVQRLTETGEWECTNEEVRNAIEGLSYSVTTGELSMSAATASYFHVPIDTTATVSSIDYDSTITITHETYDPNKWIIPDSFIRGMAESGRICEAIRGHQWQPGYDHYWDDTWTGRPLEICGLCGQERYQKITEEWIEIGK